MSVEGEEVVPAQVEAEEDEGEDYDSDEALGPDSERERLSINRRQLSKGPTGYTGLSNQGATCYLNSLMQTLFMTPEVRHKLFSWRYDPKLHGTPERSIPLQLQVLFGRLQLTERKTTSTTLLTQSFGWDSNEAFVQHDVNELCHILFDALDKTFAPNLYRKHSELKKIDDSDESGRRSICEKYDELIESGKEQFISSLYTGEMMDCLLAKDIVDENGDDIGRKRRDAFLDVALVIRGCSSIEGALRMFVTPEVMDGDNMWMCEALGRKVAAIKGFRFKSFPPILNLNLKRFDYNPITWTREKLGHKVSFPFVLDVKDFISEEYARDDVETRYDLFSIMIHSGSAGMGHYFAYVKSFETGKWYEFNDTHVEEIDEEKVKTMYGSDEDANSPMSTNAYMLSYRSFSLHGISEVCDTEEIPPYVRDGIMKDNAEVEALRERVKMMDTMVRLRLFTHNRRFLMETVVKRTDTLARVHTKVFLRLKKKYPKYAGRYTKHCLRLREYALYGNGRTFEGREHLPVTELGFRRIHTLMIDFRELEAEFEPRQRWVNFHVSALFPGSKKFGYAHRVRTKVDVTLGDLRQQFLGMFVAAYERKSVPVPENLKKENVSLIVYRKNILEPLDLAMDENLLEDESLNLQELDMLYVELVPDGGFLPRGLALLEDDIMCYHLRYNRPGEKVADQVVKCLTTASLLDLKKEIAQQLDLPIEDFRMLNPQNAGRPFVLLEKTLAKTKLFTGASITLELGGRLKSNEHNATVYRYTPLESLIREDGEARLARRTAALLVQSVIRQKAVEAGYVADPAKWVVSIENWIARRKQIRRDYASRMTYWSIEYEDRQYVTNTTDSYDRKKRQFVEVAKFLVSEQDTLLSVKEKVAEKLEVPPDRLRLWEKYYFRLGKVLRADEASVVKNYPTFSLQKQFAVEVLEEPQLLHKGEFLLKVREWHPDTWQLDPSVEMVYHLARHDVKGAICEMLTLDPDTIQVSSAPDCIRTSCYNMTLACFPWHLEKVSDRLSDGDTVIFRKKGVEEKYDTKMIKRYYHVGGASSTKSWYNQPEQALKISTEFDTPANSGPTEFPDKEPQDEEDENETSAQ